MNHHLANLIVKLIPATCPFARTLHVAGFKLTIPPLCKLNPAYNWLMQLRFNTLNNLAKQAPITPNK